MASVPGESRGARFHEEERERGAESPSPRHGDEKDDCLRWCTHRTDRFLPRSVPREATLSRIRAEPRPRSKRAVEVYDRRSIVNIYDDAAAIDVYVTDIRAANG